MALPSYEEVYDYVHAIGMEPRPLEPYASTSTRQGLARYLRDCRLRELWAYEKRLEPWKEMYLACQFAYASLYEQFHIRLPRSTFKLERHRVEEMILSEPRPRGTSVEASADRLFRDKVLRWARSN